jgi:hypothetical protein
VTGDDMPRFSDSELIQLRQEFEEHKEEQERCWERQEERWEQLAVMVEQNTQTTRELAESVCKIADSTAGVVRVYDDVQSAARIGGALQRFLLWLGKWGAIGTGAVVVVRWVLHNFPPPGPGG